MNERERIDSMVRRHPEVYDNPLRREMIRHCIDFRETLITRNGALALWTRPESTGRSPKDTYIVREPKTSADIDWDAPNNIPMDPGTLDMILEDALSLLAEKPRVYVTDRVIGADSGYALPVHTVTDSAVTALFTDNMFRPIPADIHRSRLNQRPFTLVVLPNDKLDPGRYTGRLRELPDGTTSNMVVAMDYSRDLGVIVGSAYLGSVKKLMFTVMNYMLPGIDVLPLHTSANEGADAGIALFLGLSGTGKTTLSADPDRALLGDDEHGWSEAGVSNFENGCYAKLINLSAEKEPEIHRAVMHDAPPLEHGAILENVMVYPDGSVDMYDNRLTENSRGSYLLTFLSNIKTSSRGSHPYRILFLTADANGVLPPVAQLTEDQAMLWFLMGYTSKLAGTETGIEEPVSTFSRFFGAPFMPRNPDVYATMLGEKLKTHGTRVFLVNTGWSGGPYGVGHRMDITVTRHIIRQVLDSDLEGIDFEEDPRFHIMVPVSFPGVDEKVLHPEKSWADAGEFRRRADALAADFSSHYDKAYGGKPIAESIRACCPGK
ncbi:MAG: phosphoenolpyruvate carboxykinase (ATP) [Acidobacteriota bacterium]|jgi:phosphoenolpyruvate carboxykinase (ATP)|nr:phosphoenolpyruvate carboxykinase (ATP) [Acidobacteriota bacterium]